MNDNKFVGRAGEKLDFALNHFKINVADKICADFGSSVGGFVDCLLQHGAKKVYAVETGYGVLDWGLRKNPRVVVMERINAMHVQLPEKMDLITIDASWTKQENIIPNALKNLKPGGQIITLIKPHYEAGIAKLAETEAEMIARQAAEKLKSFDINLKGLIKSPIIGGKAGNCEYIALLESQADFC
jgi:23S rRNA (cytidine1920-2'-O)/16S rRNA (cytidine1409-2'-O)-methyltransferase